MQLWMRLPVLVQDEQQLLRPPQRERGDEAPPAPPHDLVHRGREPVLPVLLLLVDVDAVGGLADEDVGTDGGQLGGHQVAVLLAGEVARVQHADAFKARDGLEFQVMIGLNTTRVIKKNIPL